MRDGLIRPVGLWTGGRLLERREVVVERGRVAEVRDVTRAAADLSPVLLAPALTDLQVNGGGGVMLNSDPTPEGLAAIVAAHRRLGTGGLLATVITDLPEVTEAAAEAVMAAMPALPGLLGLHIEGPHIAVERKGTHDPARIRPLDLRTVELVERLRAADVPVMITLAPELADPALLRRLAASGAVVSAGHSAATAEEAEAGLANGVTCFTHLYNAMPPMASRAPGILGAALVSDAYAGIIVDGIHSRWDMVKIALRARPRRGLTFAVSDAMATVGGPDHFTLYGQTIHVKDGALVNAEGSLAGAHIDMVGSLANLVRHVGVPLAEAVAMCTDVPRRVIGLPPQEIGPGTALADLIALDDDLTLMETA
ncbi:N-acetylglucosamine-6-phosphate deacetylase [Wenxinia marina]|uniref:N-acetylglucosamine 6-phosphate deacetylase n=1 Tax=Wenxinia marina DSM 24838 TaxID=1123501 RepID=A0A0D0Q5U7_9RHOB|nr:N-acetylglucosamine-6-phosphate deacetylase [Wenxinia marina]KIQ69854.1 N-acetylglucosamine 6-phosphate deacetylase [Wenxinia marina DSM 24838]GGL61706.1 N-acetylglucosamine-6-phosphate deacetylase [Wenxinia marina]